MTLEAIDTAEQVFDALGGNTALEILTGAKPTAVCNWRAFQSFPPNTYVVMIEALRAVGKTAPASLWRMRARERVV